MPGFSDYFAEGSLNLLSGNSPAPSLASRFLALFTAPPTSDAGTGGTEVSGGSYARVQVAGALAAGAAWTTSSTALTLASAAPAWLTALGNNGSGVNVFDSTTGQQIGTVSVISGVTVTLTATAAHASSGSADTLVFSAWPSASGSSGSEPLTAPATVTNGSSITFPTATANWGTVVFFGLYDALTSGNYLGGDYLGSFKWIPFTCTSATPGVLTADTSADAPANGSSVVVAQKYGGTLPTTGGSWAGLLTTANLSGATFTAGVNTTSIGGGQFRQVSSQSIPGGVAASFAASTLTLTSA
jgi:hypothetical protein